MARNTTDTDEIPAVAGSPLSFDLNLLKVFDAIMTDRSLTAAARRLGKTQSAMSHSLNRLREHTGDKLFERTSNGVRPTPRAIDMEKDVRRALSIVYGALQQSSSFDPASEARTFLIDIPVGFDWVVAPKLAEALTAMPNLTLKIANARAGNLLSELRLRETWLALDYFPLSAAGYRAETLMNEEIVVVARTGHPKFKRGFDIKVLDEIEQVGVGWSTFAHPISHPLDERIAEAGLPREVRLWVPTLATMYAVMASTDFISYGIRRTAQQFAKVYKLQIYDLPQQVRPIPLVMAWHEGFDNDQGHRWLRDRVREICKAL